MKPLDDFIKSNSESFNTEEPLPGHFDRFNERLDTSAKHQIHGRKFYFLRIAAAVIAGLLITYAAFRELSLLSKNAVEIISAASYPELHEAENFYNNQLNVYFDKLNSLKFYDKAQKQQIMDELSNMDRQAKNIKEDLIQNPDDERVQQAIINYYQVKIEFIDMMIDRARTTNKTIL